jgi:hypothetical protein
MLLGLREFPHPAASGGHPPPQAGEGLHFCRSMPQDTLKQSKSLCRDISASVVI